MAFRSKHNVVLTDPPSRLNLSSMSTAVSNPSLFTCPSSTPYSPSSQTSGSVTISRRKLLRSKKPGCINSCLDAMKGSSPPRIRSTKEFSLEGAGQDMVDAAYRSWIIKHPSALSMFEEMMNASTGKQIVVFLDYDGTLSPIVDDPDRAYMSDKMRSTVQEVARYFPTAIISGRCRDKVYDFVRLAELYYAGSHGMDIMGPSKSSRGSKNKDILLYQPASAFLPMIDQVFETLVEKTKRISGACVENNRFCLSVHFRRVEEKSWSALAEQVRSVIKEYPELRLTQGRKVLEIRPIIKWDKGKALEFLLESLGLADCNDVLPLYIGDDRTDEDAFKVLRDRGQGYGILVSTVPKETKASYSLKEPSEVMDFLHRLVKFSQGSI